MEGERKKSAGDDCRQGDNILFNAPLDIDWAQPAPDGFPRLCHVFHQEWFGIRTAAGYLPGEKIGIPFHGNINTDKLRSIVEFVKKNNCEHILLHSDSSNMAAVARMLRGSFSRAVKIYSIWHGNTAQFHLEGERTAIRRFCDLKRDGVLDHICFVKPGMGALSEDFFGEALLNVPPYVDAAVQRSLESPTGKVLIPVPLYWGKNFYTNYFAACAFEGVAEIHVVAQGIERFEEFERGRRVVEHGHLDRASLFALVAGVDLALNMTLCECQPMAALESLAFDVPCLTGPLDNGALDLHPLQELVQMHAPDSIGAQRQAIERVLRFRREEPESLAEMMADYRAVLTREAFARYLRLFDA